MEIEHEVNMLIGITLTLKEKALAKYCSLRTAYFLHFCSFGLVRRSQERRCSQLDLIQVMKTTMYGTCMNSKNPDHILQIHLIIFRWAPAQWELNTY